MNSPQPATPSPGSAGQPPDFYARLVTALENLSTGVANMRAVKLYRASSAIVRWVIMVVAIGAIAAFILALLVDLLVSLVPNSG